jgi:hypothetical protein
MIELPDESLEEIDAILPYLARSDCRELLLESMEYMAEGLSKDEFLEIATTLGSNVGKAAPLDTARTEKILQEIEFDLNNLWELPTNPEKWEPFRPLFDDFQAMTEGIHDKEKAMKVLLQILSMGLVVRFKQLEDRFRADDSQTYEEFMRQADAWVRAVQQLKVVLKYREPALKYFSIRKAQYDSGKVSGIIKDEAKQEFLKAAVEEAKGLLNDGKAKNPSEAARKIVFAWRDKPHTATWFEREDGTQLYADPESAIERAIRKAEIFPKKERKSRKK